MKTTYRLLFAMLLGLFLHGVSQAQGTVKIPSGATVPTKCTPKANDGLFYKNAGSNIGLHECTALDTWTYRGSISFGGTLTPTALSGNVDNYNPTGFASSFAVRIDGGASDRNITGLAAGGDGRLVMIINIGSTNTLTLKDASGSSTAANRFLVGADVVLGINQTIVLRYDGTSSRWRPFTEVLTSSGVTAGSYGPSTITVDAQGRVTAASISTATALSTPLLCTDAGANDTYTCTPSPAIVSYVAGVSFIFTPNTSNTGAATINVNALGAKNIKKFVGAAVSDPADGDLRATARYLLTYDGTQFLIMSTLGGILAEAQGGTGVSALNALNSVSYNAGDFTASSGTWTVDSGDVKTFAYQLNGKQMTIYFVAQTTSVSATPAQLIIAIPAGKAAAARVSTYSFNVNNGAARVMSECEINPVGSATISCYVSPGAAANWAAATNTTNLAFTITFPIQ